MESLLQEIKPTEIGSIPPHPLDRCHDLYFLDLAEHFPLVLSPEVNEQLLLRVSMPYLGVGGDQRLLRAFEAAHSVILAIFLAPHNFNLVISHMHPYIDALFQVGFQTHRFSLPLPPPFFKLMNIPKKESQPQVFPQNLSSRQFRMAIKTLIRVTSPPSVISEQDPILSSTILQLVLQRLETTATSHPLPLPLPLTLPLPSTAPGTLEESAAATPSSPTPGVPLLTEQAALILTLIDSLPYLTLTFLEEWLNITASSIHNFVADEAMKQVCKERFWEILSNGEMDMDGGERAALCVTWWTTKGGRETVVEGTNQVVDDKISMSGAVAVVAAAGEEEEEDRSPSKL